MKKKIFGVIGMFAILSLSVLSNAAENIVLCGSDLIGPIISGEVLKQASERGVKVDIDMSGTYGAMKKIKEGKCDIAILALPKGSAKPENCILIPFAYQAAIVVVNVVNPLDEISTRQLYDIFSKNATVHTETWSQLGVKNIGLRNILPLVTNFSDNVVVELFKYTALDGTNLGTWVNIAGNKQNIYNMIKANNSAIGVVGKFESDSMLKIVAVSNSSTGENSRNYAFRPDADSLYNGDYPLTLGFYVACKKDSLNKLKPLISILMSDMTAKKIDATDFFSAPENSRKKSILELDMLQ